MDGNVSLDQPPSFAPTSQVTAAMPEETTASRQVLNTQTFVGQSDFDLGAAAELMPQPEAEVVAAVAPQEFQDLMPAEPTPAPEVAPILNITEFASRPTVDNGGITYDLYISGLDGKDLRNELRDSLADSRLGWDVEEILKSIKKGNLQLKGLSSVRTSVVVNRLKALPLEIRWKQNTVYE